MLDELSPLTQDHLLQAMAKSITQDALTASATARASAGRCAASRTRWRLLRACWWKDLLSRLSRDAARPSAGYGASGYRGRPVGCACRGHPETSGSAPTHLRRVHIGRWRDRMRPNRYRAWPAAARWDRLEASPVNPPCASSPAPQAAPETAPTARRCARGWRGGRQAGGAARQTQRTIGRAAPPPQ